MKDAGLTLKFMGIEEYSASFSRHRTVGPRTDQTLPIMTRLYQIVAILFLAFGAFVIYLLLELSYSADYGPGPGFFSFWLGVLLILLAVSNSSGAPGGPGSFCQRGFSRTEGAFGGSFQSAPLWWLSLLLMQPLWVHTRRFSG